MPMTMAQTKAIPRKVQAMAANNFVILPAGPVAESIVQMPGDGRLVHGFFETRSKICEHSAGSFLGPCGFGPTTRVSLEDAPRALGSGDIPANHAQLALACLAGDELPPKPDRLARLAAFPFRAQSRA
jgi:hypothetical protein